MISYQRLWAICLLFALILLNGCSSFKREWKLTLAQPNPVPREGISGPWEGSWISEVNGHHGPLRCLITPGTNGTYQAWFRAKYKKVVTLSFAYKVSLEVISNNQNSAVVFSGEEDLGKLAGGVYTYKGQASPTNFFSTYRCSYDHGTFEMTRPVLPPSPAP